MIDQAKGILVAARCITAGEAFTLLVQESQNDNVKLIDQACRAADREARYRVAGKHREPGSSEGRELLPGGVAA
ncbi:ANTAR domain-containing protein [Amycolatopsis sp. cmx-4-61]|uniref:ANTAR domain-containing protein n=1 Tax=Amycolatopsis sp. cmx-4-61 TaxID=2790937 RepID=UPI00397BBDEF